MKKEQNKSIARKIIITILLVSIVSVTIFFAWSQLSVKQAKKVEGFSIAAKNLFNRANLGGFCGRSSFENCDSDEECVLGCGNECVAAMKGDDQVLRCSAEIDQRECADKRKHDVECGCEKGKCQWRKR